MATITGHEAEQIERANTSEQTPVVFVHGLWLLPSRGARCAAVGREGRHALAFVKRFA